MSSDDFAWLDKMRSRWLRPNGHLYVRPDGARYLRPDGHRYLRPDHARFDPLDALVRKYSPDQPRVPAGNPDGGQWTDGNVGNDISPDAPADTDEFESAQKPRGRGHHWVAREIFENEKYNFRPETLQVFEDETTGPLNDPKSNRYDRLHRQYNKAVEDAVNEYLKRNNISSEQMSPGQAKSFVEEIKASREPRILQFRTRMLLREALFWLRRGPRGRE